MKLLSVKAVGVLAMCLAKASTAAKMEMEHESNAMGMLEMSSASALEKSILQVVKEGGIPILAPFIAKMRGMIENNLLKELRSQLESAQASMDNRDKTAFQSCHKQHFAETLETLSKRHQDCRKVESDKLIMLDETCKPVELIAERMIYNCTRFQAINNLDNYPENVPEACDKVEDANISNEAHFAKLGNMFTEKLKKWDFLKEACKVWTNESLVVNASCDNATNIYNNQTDVCQAHQNKLDGQACEVFLMDPTKCQLFATCWQNAQNTFMELNSSVAESERGIKDEFVSLQRVDCFLSAFEDLDTVARSVGECNRKTFDTNAMSIVYPYFADKDPVLPPQPKCNPTRVIQPGTPAYIAEEYDVLPKNAPADECRAACCKFCKYFTECGKSPRKEGVEDLEAYDKLGCCEHVCNITAPENGATGDCPPQIESRTSCQPMCLTGYEVSGKASCQDGNLTSPTCSDINECEQNLHHCATNAKCNNTEGSYTCACKPGYNGNGLVCSSINECDAGHDCSPNAACSDTVGSFSCTCNPGYQGNGTVCTPIPCTAVTSPQDGSFGNCKQEQESGSTCAPFCDAGYSLTGNSTCTLGEFTSGSCQECLVGFYTSEPSAATKCSQCEGGSTSRRRATSCMECGEGSFDNQESSDDCETCVGGATRRRRATTCTECPVGEFDSGETDDCKKCVGGESRRRRATECTECAVAHFNGGDLDDCTPCIGGGVQRRRASTCVMCDSGKYNDGETDECRVCEGGFTSRRRATTCQDCPLGHYDDAEDADDCKVCIGGSVRRRRAKSCTECEEGTYDKDGDSDDCVPIVGGETSRRRAQTFTECKVGFFNGGGSDDCKVCEGGSVQRRRATSCTECKPGFWDDGSGDECTQCKGSVSRRRATTCTPCPEGFEDDGDVDECRKIPVEFSAHFENRTSYCITAEGGVDRPKYTDLAMDKSAEECAELTKKAGLAFFEVYSHDGKCRGLDACPHEHDCASNECTDVDKTAKVYQLD
eukprot:TRINITY_DN47917_c0_g1_i1.p1 TRINITY_DN47917_c0_g1~~TRINITY_DN47917_c0_g1_i1.p1  ORF type:complete len:999 (-),score=202.24 TRINITY_DN47917_c0_g1_i1:250-3246(-)